jgi:hypothetical protein
MDLKTQCSALEKGRKRYFCHTFVPDSEQNTDASQSKRGYANFAAGKNTCIMKEPLRGKDMIYRAAENFKQRTLSTLPTLLERLAYICSLQMPDGQYRHWGLTRAFGARQAQDAIRAAHAEIATAMVESPVREIYREYQEAVGRDDGPEVLKPESFVLTAPVNDDALLSAHLRLLQDSVQALAHQERTTPQVA